MTVLNATAKIALREAGVAQVEWSRVNWGDGKWSGDACGCPDDRCIGFHHEGESDCGCLPTLLRDYLAGGTLHMFAITRADYLKGKR